MILSVLGVNNYGGSASKFVKGDGSLDSNVYQTLLTNPIGGTGTTDFIAKFKGLTAIGNSSIFDNGTNIGIGLASGFFGNVHLASANSEIRTTSGYSTAFQNQGGQLTLSTIDTASINKGGVISFGGKFTTAGATGYFGRIGGRKENNTDNNNDGFLNFETSNDSGKTLLERMRITSDGKVGIGTTGPSALLHVSNTITPVANSSGSGVIITPTFVATSNFQQMTGLYVYPTFNNGIYGTGSNVGLNVGGGNVGIITAGSQYGVSSSIQNSVSGSLMATYYSVIESNQTGLYIYGDGTGMNGVEVKWEEGSVGYPVYYSIWNSGADSYIRKFSVDQAGNVVASGSVSGSSFNYGGGVGSISASAQNAVYTLSSPATHVFGTGTVVNHVQVANGTFNIANQTANTIASFDATKNVVSLPLATYPSLTELAYVRGVTGPIQTQLNTRLAVGATFFVGTTLIANNRASAAQTLTGVSIDGNADTVDGYHASASTVANNIVVRDGNGYISGNYINMSDDGNPGSGTSISSFITKQGDNYYRSVSPTNAMNSVKNVASGTWSINVTGSSTIASSANFLNTNNQLTYGASGLNYFNLFNAPGTTASLNQTPGTDWYHITRMNHANAAGYYADLAIGMTTATTEMWVRRISAGVGTGWTRMIDTLNFSNYALPLSGGTLTGPLFGTGATFSGNVTAAAFFASSDAKMKDIIERDGDTVKFTWKDKRDDKVHIGYIAQEVQEKYPDQVNGSGDELLTVNYIEVLVAKIQELENRIKILENAN